MKKSIPSRGLNQRKTGTNTSSSTSWQPVHRWYDELVGEDGHYYHKNIILPKTVQLLQLDSKSHLLDLACGQGILARVVPAKTQYTGIDLAPSLIQAAKRQSADPLHQRFLVGDITKPLPLPKETYFSHACCILAIQNLAEPHQLFKNVGPHLLPNAKLLIVMNHPSFRIPRQSSWGFDESTKIQYRKLNSYMSPQTIPIQMHPGKKDVSATTLSYHFPLSSYSTWLQQQGFVIELIEEWCSDKISTGGAAKWENRARQEFPMFLTLMCRFTDR